MINFYQGTNGFFDLNEVKPSNELFYEVYDLVNKKLLEKQHNNSLGYTLRAIPTYNWINCEIQNDMDKESMMKFKNEFSIIVQDAVNEVSAKFKEGNKERMIYDMAIIRVEGTFAGKTRLMAKCDWSGLAVDDIKEYRYFWDAPYRLRVVATEFKVYFHYREEDTESVNEWREKYDRKKRHNDRS